MRTLLQALIGLLVTPWVAFCREDLGFEARYWKALHEGRDTSAMTSVLEGLVFPARRAEPVEQLRQKALEQLKVIEASTPIAPVVNRISAAMARSGADWPTLGGSATHAGATSEPGPLIGEEAWRYPVGWPWQASPLVEDNRVWIASPAFGTSMLCLDRATGRRLWVAPNPAVGFDRQSRAASTVIPLAARELAVFKERFDGWPLSYLVVKRDDARLLRQVPATALEKTHQPAEREPQSLVAHRVDRGTAVLVKSLLSGRTWWRFPTGYLPAEPVLAANYVFAAAEDGTLWALNLWDDQRVAWTALNPSGWGAAPVEQQGAIYLGGNDGAVYSFETKTGRLRWNTKVAEPDARVRRLFSSAAVAGGRVYLGGADGFLHALDAETGRPIWKQNCGGWIRARPFVSGKVVTVATLEGEVVALEDSGEHPKMLWTARLGRFPIYADLAGDANGVLVSTSDFDLVAYGLGDGKEQWRQSLIPCTRDGEVKICADSMPDITQAPVTVGGGRVFFAGRTGFVIASDATTGRTLWPFECGGRVSASPLTRDRRVFVAQVGGNQKFYAIDAKTGQPLWLRSLGEI